ncbi:retrovirus-related Pol polyprotein from transposon opus [Trichonephila clavipes]|nr:retrovirus-related Pol polyprotein from transposon opus [Trichonephila clavipes]
MSKEALVDHIFVCLEPQVQDYVEGRNPQFSCWSRVNHRNRSSSTNFSRDNQRQGCRVNVLRVRDEQNDRSQSPKEVPIKLSTICMHPVELPYVPILLDETFTKALWDTGTEKSLMYEDIYQKYFFYKQDIDTGDKQPVISRPYRYYRVKKSILDYHVEKMLKERTIIPIQSPDVTPAVLCRKNKLQMDNPEVYRFVVNYRKLNAITKYPRYPLPLIDDLITNIPHTTIMSSLELHSGYFQLAVNPSDIVTAAFVRNNGTYAFRPMPFGLSGTALNFQKAIDILLKPVIGRIVNVYMDDVIRSSPLFTHHVEYLRKVFRLLHESGLTLNRKKCKFGCDKLKYLGLIIRKDGITTDETKVRAIEEMRPSKNSKKEQMPFIYASRTLSSAERSNGTEYNGTERVLTVTERVFGGSLGSVNKFKTYLGSLPIKVITDHAALTHLTHVRELVLSSREQLIEEQRKDPELDHIYRYLENPKDSSVNAAICENWSRDFRLQDIKNAIVSAAKSIRLLHVALDPIASQYRGYHPWLETKMLGGNSGSLQSEMELRRDSPARKAQ